MAVIHVSSLIEKHDGIGFLCNGLVVISIEQRLMINFMGILVLLSVYDVLVHHYLYERTVITQKNTDKKQNNQTPLILVLLEGMLVCLTKIEFSES